ncbi:hypothetical protein L1049_006737 [Liquidambar formosana]|uniref:Protein kinase domain-containing protein n=1 Tax=Liquidambar formosana TaxID=63359 RepID=A0AAP0RHS0_LIQFO
MATAYIFVFFVLSNLVLLHSTEGVKRYSNNTKCPLFYCGDIGKISILFTNYTTHDSEIDCRSLTVDNCTKPGQKFQLESGGKLYDVLSIYPADGVGLDDPWLHEHLQSCKYENLTSPISPISFNSTPSLTVLECDQTLNIIPHPYYSFIGYPDCNLFSSYPLRRCSRKTLNMNHPNNDLNSLIAVNIFPEVRVSRNCRMCHYEDECRNNDNGKLECDDANKGTNMKEKSGEGGYGSVYKGKLHDGRLVAVKVMNESKGNGEEFVNEVASISRTSHVNIVTLLGFCFQGSKRALFYEFMPNRSLEKFIYETPLKGDRQLGWKTLYQIAIGIAQGLEYLHHGCNTRILHFDIKPHNILLDENFCPKISDFGLSKLCQKKESIVSMQGARGTAGYIAPEVLSRHFGGVSHKSDVYSYGMIVLEMVGGRKNIDVGVGHTSEIYFPHWIYKRLHEQSDQLGLHGVMNEEENEKVRKMILVGLWCIQTYPSNRPPMNRVLDMLQGSLGSLQIPPRPFLSSPPRSPVDSSTTHVMTL